MIADEAIVLAGGRGSRLAQVVRDVPKPLAPVAGRPFLAWLLDALRAGGMRRCILATGYLSDMVRDNIGSCWNGMQIDYSVEEHALGTGGAVARACGLAEGAGVHVVNGDTYLEYTPAALQAATERASARVGVALARVEDVARYGVVDQESGLVRAFREKGGSGAGWINAGCYFLERDALARFPRDTSFSFEKDFLEPLVASGEPVAAFGDTDGFVDIGVPEDYARAQAMFAQERT